MRQKTWLSGMVLVGVAGWLMAGAVPDSAGEGDFGKLLKKLAVIETIEGKAIGAAGSPGAFYVVANEMLKTGKASDFAALLSDQRPVGKLMGVYCLVKSGAGNVATYAEQLKSVYADNSKVKLFPYGCIGNEDTVGGIAKKMVENPDLLEGPKPVAPAVANP